MCAVLPPPHADGPIISTSFAPAGVGCGGTYGGGGGGGAGDGGAMGVDHPAE